MNPCGGSQGYPKICHVVCHLRDMTNQFDHRNLKLETTKQLFAMVPNLASYFPWKQEGMSKNAEVRVESSLVVSSLPFCVSNHVGPISLCSFVAPTWWMAGRIASSGCLLKCLHAFRLCNSFGMKIQSHVRHANVYPTNVWWMHMILIWKGVAAMSKL